MCKISCLRGEGRSRSGSARHNHLARPRCRGNGSTQEQDGILQSMSVSRRHRISGSLFCNESSCGSREGLTKLTACSNKSGNVFCQTDNASGSRENFTKLMTCQEIKGNPAQFCRKTNNACSRPARLHQGNSTIEPSSCTRGWWW